MKDVMSVRLDPAGLRRLKDLAKRERKEVSAVARELMDYGWILLMLREYRAGKRSLEAFAQALDVSLSEAIDLLADSECAPLSSTTPISRATRRRANSWPDERAADASRPNGGVGCVPSDGGSGRPGSARRPKQWHSRGHGFDARQLHQLQQPGSGARR